jgi:hypothetical protein
MSYTYKPRKIKKPAVERIYTPAELKVKTAIDARIARRLYNHVDRAYFHRERSETVAEVLRDAIEAAAANLDQEEFDELMALVKRMKHCSSRENHYLAKDLHNESTGEVHDGFGILSPCSSKLCHSCVAYYAKRNHKTAAAAMNEIVLINRKYKDYTKKKKPIKEQMERLRFVTLTMPAIRKSCFATLRIILDAWERFRKTDFFKNYVSGFARDAEFTTRKDGTYHAHIHLIVASVFLPDDEFKAQWTNCVEKAFHKAGLEFEAATKSGYCVVNFELVRDVESATRELCKYITKSDSWSEVPQAHLLEMASVARWPKMFALGGTFAVAAARLERQRSEARAAAIAAIGDSSRFGSAHDAIDAERDGYVHTKSLSDGFTSVETSEDFEYSEEPAEEITGERPKKFKKPNWRNLVRKIGLKKYEIVLDAQVEAQQSYRKIQLRQKYPLATFTDLTGKTWAKPCFEFVEEIEPEREVEWIESHKLKLLSDAP